MRTVDLPEGHAKKHFEFFRDMNHPHFSICAPVDVTSWVGQVRERGLRLNSTLVFLLARAANNVPQLKRRIRGEALVEHEHVHPSFTVPTGQSDVFSFCDVEYHDTLAIFLSRCEIQIAAMKDSPSLEDTPGRDDYLFMSAIPWVSFTSITHAMQFHPHDSVPRISWGKITEAAGRLSMPVSIQAHHAIVDGSHLGRFFQEVESAATAGLPDES